MQEPADYSKTFLLEKLQQNDLTPQTQKEQPSQDQRPPGSQSPLGSQRSPFELPGGGVQNVTFMHQNHLLTFPYE